ncbi:hypothetical protein K6989_02495 [Mycoplasmopsis synoviae]|uniref:hypothetical protein n=1 Tax=Mycoplasmopsis synoviae TaxID=2109 RepID=UPI001CE0B4CE|nr:hypothetical protein [Mycoplasmopsis synoviae]UBX97239.1 hypothetical protein K6989_02495 [Mycoplasmopsis synoviae]
MQFISGSVTAAKAVKEDAEYSKVTDTTHKTTLEEKYTAAISLLEGETKLKNLDASSNLVTTKASLESAKTALDAAVSALMPELTFVKTKTSVAAKVTELESLVNPAFKAELQRQVTALDKDQAAQATTMLENLTSLKESLESLQTLVSDGLKMQVDYPQKYYDADNKADFDTALLKASSVFPAFQWTTDSIMVETPEGQLPNPRAWTKARDKSEFKLQNFVIAPAQAAAATAPTESGSGDGSGGGTSAAASATVRVANGETASADGTASREAQTTPDLASTVSYLKSLNDTLKATTDALNGDNPTTKTAYYKADTTRTLYWDGFMPKIVVQGYQADSYVADDQGNNRAAQEKANKTKLEAWFREESNWAVLEDQLTRKLGKDKFKNMVLSTPTITWDEVEFSNKGSNKVYLTPKVTFNLAAKNGYTLAKESAATVTLTIRVLYKDSNLTRNVLSTQGAYYTAAPKNAIVDDANVKAKVNVYLNYTGPSIVLDEALPTVGGQENTLINGTSNVTGEFNTKFRKLLVSVFRQGHAQSSLFQAVINYVNKFDPKFRATFVTNSINGVTITKVQNTKELRPGTLDDLNKNNVFLQQIQGDTEAVYLPVTALTNDKWLNTVLVRIPLTKFVRPVSVLEEQSAQDQTPEASQQS